MLLSWAQVLYCCKQFFYSPTTCSGEVQVNLRCSIRKLSTPTFRATFLIEVDITETPEIFVQRRKVSAVVQAPVSFRQRDLCISKSHPWTSLTKHLKVETVVFLSIPLAKIVRPHHILNHFHRSH